MSNLEILNLSLSIAVEEIFFDGHHLNNEIIPRMPRLNQLTFDIRSTMKINTETFDLSREHIQTKFKDISNTFKDVPMTQVKCYMDYFRDRKECQCHAYTYPSQMSFYQYLSNQFSGGYYPYVRLVSLYDEYRFQHRFFLQLVQSFPLIQKLVLFNEKP